MTLKKNRVLCDQIRAGVAEMKTALVELRTHATLPTLGPDYTAIIERAEELAALILVCAMNPKAPQLASGADLAELKNQLGNLNNNYRAQKSNGLPGAIAAIDGSLEALIKPLSTLVTMINGSTQGRAADDVARTQLESARQQVEQAVEKLRSLDKSKAAMEASLAALNQQAQSFLAQQNQSFLAAQSAHEASLRKISDEFREEQRKLTDTMLHADADRSIEAKQQLTAFVATSDSAMKEFVENRQGRLDALEKLHSEARQIVGAIGETAQAGGYERVAAEAEQRAIGWERVTIACMVTVVLVAGYSAFCEPISPSLNSIGKLVLVAALGLLSRYGATVGNRARREHLWAKQRGLELKALAGYLENFGVDDRVALRKQLIDKYFGVGSTMLNEVASNDPAPTSSHDAAIELFRAALDKLPAQSAVEFASAFANANNKETNKK